MSHWLDEKMQLVDVYGSLRIILGADPVVLGQPQVSNERLAICGVVKGCRRR